MALSWVFECRTADCKGTVRRRVGTYGETVTEFTIHNPDHLRSLRETPFEGDGCPTCEQHRDIDEPAGSCDAPCPVGELVWVEESDWVGFQCDYYHCNFFITIAYDRRYD